MISRVFIPPLLLFAASVWAGDCEEVVSDTVGEMRAGASGWWSDDVENLVRAAAGSACVKALSGRYGSSVAAQIPAAGPADTGEAAASGEAVAEVSAQPASEATASAASQAAEDSEAGEFSFGGLTFRSLSGSPSKKPYERNRESGDN